MLWLFTLEKRRLRAISSMCTNGRKGSAKKLEPGSSQWWTLSRGNGHELKHRQFPLNTRRHFLTVRTTEHWHRFPREHLHPWRHSKAIWVWSRTTGLGWSLALLDQLGWTKLPLSPLPTSDILCFYEHNWQEEKPWRSKRRCQRLLFEDWQSKVLAGVRSQRRACWKGCQSMPSIKILKTNWQRIHDVPRGYWLSMVQAQFRLNEMGK